MFVSDRNGKKKPSDGDSLKSGLASRLVELLLICVAAATMLSLFGLAAPWILNTVVTALVGMIWLIVRRTF